MNSKQLKIILGVGVVLLAIAASFGGYYVYSEYYKEDTTKEEDSKTEVSTENQEASAEGQESSYTYELNNERIYVLDSKTNESTEVSEISEAVEGDPIEKMLVSPSGDWIAYGVSRGDITNVGGQDIGEIYEWQVYNVNYGGIVILNDRTFETSDGLTITVNRAEKWVSDYELVVVEDGGMTWAGVLIYNAETDVLRELTAQEMQDYGYEGMF